MKTREALIKDLCHELKGMGIQVEAPFMEMILNMQDKDYRELTKAVNPDQEVKKMMLKMKHLQQGS